MNDLIAEASQLPYKELKQYFEDLDLKTLHQLKLDIDDQYEYGDVLLDDEQYDLLVDVIKERDPKYVPPIGFKIHDDDNRVIVPYHMGSMDKIRPHVQEEVKEFKQWLKNHETTEYLIEDKLDGVSCLIVVKNGKYTLYKRPGRDGYGADITPLLKYFKTIPTGLKNMMVRGELVVKKDVFEKKYKKNMDGSGGDYRTQRGMVAGITGAKTVRKGIKDIQFVAYERVYEDGVVGLKPTDQLEELKDLGFITVKRELVDEISINILSELLVRFREESPYEIDGIIVQPNEPYERNLSGNPTYAFAFKMRRGDAIVDATVIRVKWTVKRSRIKPRVEIKPVMIDGYKNSSATAFNAKFVENNNIGPGAIIRITRSGDVIPHIISVVKPAAEAQMPDIEYYWGKTGVDIYAIGAQREKCISTLHYFFETLVIKGLGEKSVEKIYDSGLDNVFKILMATKKDFEHVEGFGKGLASNTYNNIHNTLKKGVTIAAIIASSSIFQNFKVKRCDELLSLWPGIFEDYKSMTKFEILQKMLSLPSFGPVLSQVVADNIAWVDVFIQAMKLFATIKTIKLISDNLSGMKIVFTGIRDKDLEEEIHKRGGKVTTNISSKTSALIVKNKADKPSGKQQKAQKLGIPQYEKQEFIDIFIK